MNGDGLADQELQDRLHAALVARTAGDFGRVDSLQRLLSAQQSGPLRSPPARRRRLAPALGAAGVAFAIAVIVLVAFVLANPPRSTSPPAHPRPSVQQLPRVGTGYPAAEYYPAVRDDGQPVVVRAADDQPVRILPRGRLNAGRWAPLSPMVLSPDGTTLYGIGRDIKPDGTRYGDGWGSEHALAVDLRTNTFNGLAPRDGLMTGFTLSADGTTFAYALRGGTSGMPDRDLIYVHDLVHDTDRHIVLEAGQRAVAIALSPDGARLAFVPATQPSDVRLLSTVTGQTPGQRSLDAASCTHPSYGPLAWTRKALYGVQTCSSGGRLSSAVVEWADPATQLGIAVIQPQPGRPTALVACATSRGTVIYLGGGTLPSMLRFTPDASTPKPVRGLTLSGPGTGG